MVPNRINPKYADAYLNRGNARYQLGDKQNGFEDFNTAIRLNPNYTNAYYNQGLARSALGDKQGALADYRRAADLAEQQKNTDLYQKVQNPIEEIQR